MPFIDSLQSLGTEWEGFPLNSYVFLYRSSVLLFTSYAKTASTAAYYGLFCFTKPASEELAFTLLPQFMLKMLSERFSKWKKDMPDFSLSLLPHLRKMRMWKSTSLCTVAGNIGTSVSSDILQYIKQKSKILSGHKATRWRRDSTDSWL